jgi:hypothetical protein
MIMADPNAMEHPPNILERYELLRTAMLGAALPPDSRGGLIILLHRGMWAWARVVDRARQGPSPVSAATLPLRGEPYERSVIVHLLANIVMTITDRRSA